MASSNNTADAMDAQQTQQLHQSIVGSLLDLDSTGDPSVTGTGTFPFPLSDQASLFNFHMPAGLEVDPLSLDATQDLFGDGFGAAAATTSNNNHAAMDISLLDTATESNSTTYPTDPSLLYGQGVRISSTSNRPAQAQTVERASSTQTQMLNNVLYNMSLGGMQQLDGFYHGNITMPSDLGIQSTLGASVSAGMGPMFADATPSGSMNMLSNYTHPSISFPLASPLSPVSPLGSGNTMERGAAPASTTSQQSVTQPRIDRACKMCRRRKVRCDGMRPSCKFCTTKKFDCVYEPVASGNRKRGRRGKTSDSGSAVSSNSQNRFIKRQHFGTRTDTLLDGIGEILEGTDIDSAEESSSEAESSHVHLEALSNRQIALLDDVGTDFGVKGIMDSHPNVEHGGETSNVTASNPANDSTATNFTKEPSSDLSALDQQVKETAPVSVATRNVRLYFEYFHPQHPILHRHTFEKSIQGGTVSRALWHAVQAIGARYGPSPDNEAQSVGGAIHPQQTQKPYTYGMRYAKLVRALLPEASRRPSIEVIQALYLLSEHQFGMGDWLSGSTYWGTAVRMFNQLQLHMTDEAYQFPAYTSHLGLHESAISPLTCQQSPAHYASEMRRPTLDNASWIKREMARRMRWALFESERMHSLAGGSPPLVTLEAGWVHMPCSDALWETCAPRRAAEYERLLLHMGRYYVDTGGSLRVDIPPSQASEAANQTDAEPEAEAGTRRRVSAAAPNRVASMLVSVRRRTNRIHLNAHTAIVIGQMTRARLALFRLFFPCRWPNQLMAMDASGSRNDQLDLGGGGGATGPVVLSWEERLRRMRATISDLEAKLMQWRVYLESMFPLREHDEGSGRTDAENCAIDRERAEYANYRFMLAALIIQNRAIVLQLQACLARRERKIRIADQERDMDEPARQNLANHVLPNQPDKRAMQSLRAYAQECWDVTVRQACEIGDLLESHWQVQPHANQSLRVLIRPDWHAQDAIKAKLNADANLRCYPEDPVSGRRDVDDAAQVYFSHETPPYPLLAVNQRLLAGVIQSASGQHQQQQQQLGAELALAASMNSNIHIETNANAHEPCRDDGMGIGRSRRGSRRSRVPSDHNSHTTRRRGPHHPRIGLTEAGEVDFESAEEEAGDYPVSDPFRMEFTSTPYFLFLAAKTLIMYVHHAKMSAYLLARRKPAAGSSSAGEGAEAEQMQDAALLPEFVEDLSPPLQLRTLADIRRMQDRLEVVLTALRRSQKFWMGVDYYVLCARKLRKMVEYGPWRAEDPVSTDSIGAELVGSAWPQTNPLLQASDDLSANTMFGP
ncbi:hypothetical protein H4R24_003243 [Coemansia sp. RSA 988]|nr:hypothetical protein H4R24_003243 [Coemansia sp. RSA 988]